jgi:hypothetical protein
MYRDHAQTRASRAVNLFHETECFEAFCSLTMADAVLFPMRTLSHADRIALAKLIHRSLHLADDLGATAVGISLNDALIALIGEGVPPRGATG